MDKNNFGMIPPQALDLEEAVLGALMIDKSAHDVVIPMLKPEVFYKTTHSQIFTAIEKIFNRNGKIDILTVTERLKADGKLEAIGGPYALTLLTNRVASSANAEHHSYILIQKWMGRELIRLSNEALKSAYDESVDVLELVDEVSANFSKVNYLLNSSQNKRLDQLNKVVMDESVAVRSNPGLLIGIPSGYKALDRITNGWQNPDLVIVAARPGMGKTSFALSIARNAAIDSKKAVAIFSLEMSGIQLSRRMISQDSGVSSNQIKNGRYNDYDLSGKIEPARNTLDQANIFINDTASLSLYQFRSAARQLVKEHDVELIIIDYLQLMAGVNKKGQNREQEISDISRGLKMTAKELDVPIIALSQLSRAVETRGGDKRPKLADLRESGAIEQDADMVVFLYRPEVYGFEQDDNGDYYVDGHAEAIISKHRNGATGTVVLKFEKTTTQFSEFDYDAAGVTLEDNFQPF